MELSARLEMLFSLFPKVDQAADIGCDHAYLPIALIERGRCRRVIASDVAEGPLMIARENVRRHQLEEAISCRLSDGLDAFLPEELECFSMAGMGGMLIVSLLERAFAQGKFAFTKCMILQPQSDEPAVRSCIVQCGFRIASERMCEDRGKYYHFITAVPETPQEDSEQTGGQKNCCAADDAVDTTWYGRMLYEQRDPVFQKYLQHELKLKKAAAAQIEVRPTGEKGREKLMQLREEIAEAERMLVQWNTQSEKSQN